MEARARSKVVLELVQFELQGLDAYARENLEIAIQSQLIEAFEDGRQYQLALEKKEQAKTNFFLKTREFQR